MGSIPVAGAKTTVIALAMSVVFVSARQHIFAQSANWVRIFDQDPGGSLLTVGREKILTAGHSSRCGCQNNRHRFGDVGCFRICTATHLCAGRKLGSQLSVVNLLMFRRLCGEIYTEFHVRICKFQGTPLTPSHQCATMTITNHIKGWYYYEHRTIAF